MSTIDESSMTRATSRDGTRIAYRTSGEGPPLVLVHGAISDHTRWAPLLPYLEPSVTVHAVDRRGRGASGDHRDHSIARELEDVAAVVDAVAEAVGGPVDLLGHSFGAVCALGAAARSANVRRLVLYEPPVQVGTRPSLATVIARLDELVARGEREAALVMFLREVVAMPEAELRVYREQPSWAARVAAVHTLSRELRADLACVLDLAPTVTVPTLLVGGADSPDAVKDETARVAAALTDVRLVLLEGQQHVADVLAPEVFARHVLDFLQAA